MNIKIFSATAVLALALSAGASAQKASGPPRAFDLSKIVPEQQESGFQPIFDGKSMDGWDCDADFWRVADGEIVGETVAEHQPKQNIFCIWKGGQPADFDLKLQYKLTGETGNSGVQYRSVEMPEVAKWVMKGYQADIDGKEMFTGQVYEERGRQFLALRGQITYIPEGGKVGWIGSVGDNEQLKGFIHAGGWNDIEIIARGNTLIQLINGHVMSVLIDDDKAGRKMEGEIGIQLHKTTAAMKIETRNIRIKNF